MVDLPGIANSVPNVQAPRSPVSPAQIAAPHQELAKTFELASHTLMEDVARPAAREAGLQAVTRDADGNLIVDRAPIIGAAAVDFGNAVKVAALTEGEGVVRRDDIAMRQQYRDDPEGYRIAAEKYADEKHKQYSTQVSPEVGLALKKAIEQQTTTTYKGLLNEHERLEMARAVNSINAEITHTKNEMVALANQGDTTSPEFRSLAGKLQALTGTLVNNPRIAYPQAVADQEMDQFHSDLKSSAIAHEISTMVFDQEGPAGALQAAEQIRTDPGLNLSAGQREAAYNRAVGAVNARRRANSVVNNQIATEAKNILSGAAQGFDPPPEQLGALKQAVIANKNPEQIAAYESMVRGLNVMRQWRQQTPAQIDADVARLETTMREQGQRPDLLLLSEAGRTMADKMRKALVDDPLGLGQRVGLIRLAPIAFGGPTAATDMRVRIADAEVLAQHYGITPSYLTPDEKQALTVTTAAGGSAMTTMASDIASGFGDRAPRVLAEISKQAPTLAHLGGLLSGAAFGGGDPAFASDVAEGLKLQQDPNFKPPNRFNHPPERIAAAQGARRVDQYGDAFLMVPDSGRAAESSARMAFYVRAYRNNYDSALIEPGSKPAYDRALQQAAGASFGSNGEQYGGVANYPKPNTWFGSSRVLVPATIRSDKFRDVIKAITDDDLSRLPTSPKASAAQLQAGIPVASQGGYRFALGDPASDDPKWVQGADGKAFVLNLDGMADTLRKRVRGAYKGD